MNTVSDIQQPSKSHSKPYDDESPIARPIEIRGLNGLARQLLLSKLRGLKGGSLQLIDSSGTSTVGEVGELQTKLRVHNPNFFRHAVLGGSLSVAEAYLRDDWQCDDLTTLFRIFVRNIETADRLDRGLSPIAKWCNRIYHHWHTNRRNIQAHYDLGNEFFQLMLDDTLSYSSGIFLGPHSTLREASLEKIDRLCRKLDLSPNDHLLEIGTGWGALAIHAAKYYGCRVSTTTISRQQYELARERIEASGVSDRVELLYQDYRDLSGQFDKLVSVEMIEAVGYRYYDTFFRKCSQLLKPTGTMVLQAIVMPDRRYAQYLKSVDFIQRYVFPGGCLPSMKTMLESMSRATNLRFVHAEDFCTHYARTLRHWRQRFYQHMDDVRLLGYPDRFIRMWNYYLSYCEAAFEERFLGVVQILFDKPQCRRDPIMVGTSAGRVQ